MFLAKHPTLGNRHFDSVDRAALEGEGWIFWPHPEGNMPAYLPVEPAIPETPVEVPQAPEPDKKRPGRPKKGA